MNRLISRTQRSIRRSADAIFSGVTTVAAGLGVAAGALMLAVVTSPAHAQTPAAETAAAQAQLRYEARIAQCNGGTLSAPDRQACVRMAGAELDAGRRLPTTGPTAVTTDGRATVVTPSTTVAPVITPSPAAVTNGVTTPDGRATVIPSNPVTQ